MAKLTDLPLATDIQPTDTVYVVDVSDLGDSPEGTSKQATVDMVLGTSMVVSVREKIETITDPVSGEFDFSGINSSNYTDLSIVGSVLSDAASQVDNLLLYFNGDVSQTDYHEQSLFGSNGAVIGTEVADSGIILNAAAGTSIDSVPQPIKIDVPGPSSTSPKYASGQFILHRGDEYVQAGFKYVVSQNTGTVTQLRITSSVAASLSGALTLYGDREVTLYTRATF